MADAPMTFEETLATLQGLLGRRVTVFVGGSAGNPGIAAYTEGTLASAAGDEGFDELLPGDPGEALHFRVDADDGSPRIVFVLFEGFFFRALWRAENLFTVTQRDPLTADSSVTVGEPDAGVAITVRLDD